MLRLSRETLIHGQLEIHEIIGPYAGIQLPILVSTFDCADIDLSSWSPRLSD